MRWTSPDCLSSCKHRTARNADEKQARVQSKPGSRAGRNNVTVRGDMRSKCRACIRCFDRKYIRGYRVSDVTNMQKNLIFSANFLKPIAFIRPVEYNK